MQFAGAGSKYPVLDEIKALYKSEGKDPPKEMASTVYYNRGLMTAAVHLKAIEHAVKAKGGSGKITGEDVKLGFEQVKDFTLGGILPPMTITAEDHEGGGWVRVFQVQGDGFVPVSDWQHGYREEVMEMVMHGKH
jgi:branched-chain amino acid transport system substrate-binding protein